jgi:hypothetical protein
MTSVMLSCLCLMERIRRGWPRHGAFLVSLGKRARRARRVEEASEARGSRAKKGERIGRGATGGGEKEKLAESERGPKTTRKRTRSEQDRGVEDRRQATSCL